MKNKQAVWDLPVRLLHWTLAGMMATAWASSDSGGSTHEYVGTAAGGVLLLRLVWGYKGNRYARFPQFLRSPAVSLDYVRLLMQGRAPRYIGHNPLGGWMAVQLWLCVGLLVVTGWALSTDFLWGYAWPVRVHVALAWCLIGLILLHVTGMLMTSWRHRENLVAAMLDGKKALPQQGDID